LTLSGVAVEKLFRTKLAKIKSRQDALQTTFCVFLDIFDPPSFRCFEENGVFQQPRQFTSPIPNAGYAYIVNREAAVIH
jgi:hypothetical protein